MGRVLHWQLTGALGDDGLDANCAELVASLEALHLGGAATNESGVDRDVCLSMSLILANGWEQYRWWSAHEHLPADFLLRFSECLCELGFVWTRFLDGAVPSLQAALDERRAEAE